MERKKKGGGGGGGVEGEGTENQIGWFEGE